MKTNKIILIVIFVLFPFILNAQVFLGGNFGLNMSGGNLDNGNIKTDKPSTVSFNISPMVGKFLSENVAVGALVDFSFSQTNNNGAPEVINSSSTIGITPFLRYYAIRIDKFSIFGQGNVGFSYSGSMSKVDGTSTNGPKTSTLSLTVMPGLAYDVSSKLSLETNINFLNFGLNYSVVKSGSDKNRTVNFGVGAGLSNIVTVGTISIGAIYKF
jgi:outer membrane protein